MNRARSVVLASIAVFAMVLCAQRNARAQVGYPEAVREQTDAPALWRISFGDTDQLNDLAAHLDVWEADHTNRTALALLSPSEVTSLVAKGISLHRSDLDWVDVRTPVSTSGIATDAIPGYACYRTVEKTYRDLQSLASLHPTLAVWHDIGDSWDKEQSAGTAGYDILALTVTNQQVQVPKFRFLVVAAMHARELVTAEIALRFAEHLIRKYGSDPDVTWLLDYGEVHIIPQLNPDGRKFAEMLYLWRKNTNSGDGCQLAFPDGFTYGVDLNRNSSFQWNGCMSGSCSSGDPCATTYRGQEAESEPETKVVQGYARTIFADQRAPGIDASAPVTATGLIVSLHSYGELVLFPWGWTDDPSPNDDGLSRLGSRIAEPLGYRACRSGESGCLYQVDGSLEDWAYGELGVGSFTLEFGTEFFQECDYFESSILDPAIQALTVGFGHARRPYTPGTVPQIQDVKLADSTIVPGIPLKITVEFDLRDLSFGSARGFQYSVDKPSWEADPGEVVKVIRTGTGNIPGSTLTHTIETDSWPVGRRLLFVEGIDGGGSSGVPVARYVDVVDSFEYYLPVLNGSRMSDVP